MNDRRAGVSVGSALARKSRLFRVKHGLRVLLLGSGAVTLGRRSTCDYVLMDNEVSREHARIIVGEQTFAIEDLGSANGVRVNGEPITGLRRLNTGDTFQVGAQTFEVLPPTEGEMVDDRSELTVIARRTAPTQAPAPRADTWSDRPTGIAEFPTHRRDKS
jgi:pSer/pThr/pTyr-binding forkhead associated (FHA) protein